MGLHLCYELSLPAHVPEIEVTRLVSALRERALALPFDRVSENVRLTERALAAPSPLRGLAYTKLEDVMHVWAVGAFAPVAAARRTRRRRDDDG